MEGANNIQTSPQQGS